MEVFEHRGTCHKSPPKRHYSAECIRTIVSNQARTLVRMQDIAPKEKIDELPDSGDALRRNLARVLKASPRGTVLTKPGRKPAYQKIKGISPTMQRAILNGEKSPTLNTLDIISKHLGTPGWLLVHPDMKRWDKNRLSIVHIVEAYLKADDEGRRHIFDAARMAERAHAISPTASEDDDR